MPESKVTFSWRNYTKPTPKNLEAFAASIRRIIAVVATTTVVIEAVWWVPFTVLVLGALLDEAKNFFSMASQDYDEKISVNIPPAMTDKVEITENVTKDEGV